MIVIMPDFFNLISEKIVSWEIRLKGILRKKHYMVKQLLEMLHILEIHHAHYYVQNSKK